MNHKFLWCFAILILLSSLALVPLAEGQVLYPIYKDDLNSTDGWNQMTSAGSLAASLSGATETANSGSNAKAIKTVPQFFFNVPFNATYLSYLGANEVYFNFTSRATPGRGTNAGDKELFLGLFDPGSQEFKLGYNDDAGDDELFGDCPGIANNVISNNEWTTANYLQSFHSNYTDGTTNITSMTITETLKHTVNCASVIEGENATDFNITLQVSAANTHQILITNLSIMANMDADYWSNGSYSNFTNDVYFPNADEITVNFSAPVVVNTTYILNGGTTQTLCTNCQNETLFASGALDGSNNITLNFTWIRNDTTFSFYEEHSFTAGTSYALCNDNIPNVDQPVFNVTFRDEENVGTQVSTNFTIKLFDNSVLSPFLDRANEEVQGFEICFVNDTAEREVGFDLIYESADASYSERQIGTVGSQKININITNPYTIDAYLLLVASGTTITFTIEDESGIKQSGLTVEAYRFDPANNTLLFVDQEVTDVNGIALFDMVLNEQYSLVIKDGTGTILKDTGPFKISETTYTISINLLQITTGQTQLEINEIAFDLSCVPGCNHSALWINASWVAAPNTINYACLEIANRTILNSFGIINTTCLSANNGTITMDATQWNGTVLQARFFVNAVENDIDYNLKILDIDLRQAFQLWGTMGLFLAIFMLFSIMSAMVLNSPFLTIVGMMVSIFFLYLMGITALTLGTTMTVIAFGGLLLFFFRQR